MNNSPFFRPAAVVIWRAGDVDAELATLGTTRLIIATAVLEGELQRKLCTALDPPATAGFVAWARTTRSLGSQHKPLGWVREDHGISTVVDPTRRVAIGVATGDKNTGRVGGPDPKTKYPKGESTVAVIVENAHQGVLFGQPAPVVRP
ncbi:MAG: hypothetical protein QOI47_2142, partial [Actinomycetota bacterium]|nr:hypothetical protein [Actinomycetota bacterium]